MPAHRHAQSPDCDALLVGGGLTGLWLGALLRRHGHRVVLLEADGLGGTQSLASQGWIHGGLKYALTGRAGAASEALAAMPAAWRSCLHGDGQLDLRPLRAASDACWLFGSTGSLSALEPLLEERGLTGPAPAPDWLPQAATGSVARRLDDLALDVQTLARQLRQRLGSSVYRCRLRADQLQVDADGVRLQLAGRELHTRRLLLCAGAGNGALIDGLGLHAPAQRLRPLHQVLVQAPALPKVFAHWVDGAGSEPRLTISSHERRGGRIWNLGGELATQGVGRSPAAQHAAARDCLQRCLPGIDWRRACFRSLEVDRAEPDGPRRLDVPWLSDHGPLLLCWPRKLSLLPVLGSQLLARMPAPGDGPVPSLRLPAAGAASPPWSVATESGG